MTLREPIKVFGDILLSEMDLDPSQIVLAFQPYNIPKTRGLFIALSYLDTQLVGVSSDSISNENLGMLEIQSATLRHSVQIDMMSFDDSARIRKAEIPMALNSVYAKQQMERNNIQIARLPSSFVDISALEETQFLNRFAVTVACTSLALKTKVPLYFDSFDGKFIENQQNHNTSFSPQEDSSHA